MFVFALFCLFVFFFFQTFFSPDSAFQKNKQTNNRTNKHTYKKNSHFHTPPRYQIMHSKIIFYKRGRTCALGDQPLRRQNRTDLKFHLAPFYFYHSPRAQHTNTLWLLNSRGKIQLRKTFLGLNGSFENL